MVDSRKSDAHKKIKKKFVRCFSLILPCRSFNLSFGLFAYIGNPLRWFLRNIFAMPPSSAVAVFQYTACLLSDSLLLDNLRLEGWENKGDTSKTALAGLITSFTSFSLSLLINPACLLFVHTQLCNGSRNVLLVDSFVR